MPTEHCYPKDHPSDCEDFRVAAFASLHGRSTPMLHFRYEVPVSAGQGVCLTTLMLEIRERLMRSTVNVKPSSVNSLPTSG